MNRNPDFDMIPNAARASLPADQAQGMRAMFPVRVVRFIPVVTNPEAACAGRVLEHLCSVFAQLGLHSMVVDASDLARQPCELAQFDLSEGVERVSQGVSYMAARGLPHRFADARGHCGEFLDALADAAPQCDVVLLHASASELVRVFSQRSRHRDLTPLIFTRDLADGLTPAYAAIKVLSQRGGWMAYDLVMCASPASTQAALIAERLAQCADNFLGVVQRSVVQLDPQGAPSDDIDPAWMGLASGLLHRALAVPLGDAAFQHLTQPGAALPSRVASSLN